MVYIVLHRYVVYIIISSDFEYGGGIVLKESELRLVASSIPPDNPQVYLCSMFFLC